MPLGGTRAAMLFPLKFPFGNALEAVAVKLALPLWGGTASGMILPEPA